MQKKAKVFVNGGSQAVRIPKAFRFDVGEVFIRRDESTGDVILSANGPEISWAEFFEELRSLPEEHRDFMPDRNLVEST
jgi:antitoxin VapB